VQGPGPGAGPSAGPRAWCRAQGPVQGPGAQSPKSEEVEEAGEQQEPGAEAGAEADAGRRAESEAISIGDRVCNCRRMARGCYELPNVSLGPALPYTSMSCGRPSLKGPYNRFRSGRL
jgi:hypothetical protein